MSTSKIHNQGLYSDALAIIQKIVSATKGEECLFRGESSIEYDFPCASSIYRQLKEENIPDIGIQKLLEERQCDLIQGISKYKVAGSNELEKLMFFQHHKVKTNLLDFTRDYLFALFFACGELGEDGRVIVKRIDDFKKLGDKECLWSREALLEPHEDLQRARDQHGVFLHIPEGRLPLKRGETVLIRSKHKREVLDLLKKMHNKSHETIFGDVFGEIDRRNQEDEKRVQQTAQPRTGFQALAKSGYSIGLLSANTSERCTEPSPTDTIVPVHNFTKSQALSSHGGSQKFSIMGHYVELLNANTGGQNNELLRQYAEILISFFTGVLNDSPQDFEAYYNRAFVYYSNPSPNYEKAIDDYTRTIELSPNLTKVHINRGNVYSKKPNPDYELAIKDYTSELERNPDDALAYYNRGTARLLKQNPDYKRAISDYTYALELNPDYMDAYANRGNAYIHKQNPDYNRAVSDYTSALKIKPKVAEIHYARGNAYMMRLNPDHNLAISDYTSAIDYNPNYIEAYYNRGNAYANKPTPNYVEAIKDYTSAIKKSPGFALAYYARANLRAKRGDCAGAKSDYTTAVGIEPIIVQRLPITPQLKNCLESNEPTHDA